MPVQSCMAVLCGAQLTFSEHRIQLHELVQLHGLSRHCHPVPTSNSCTGFQLTDTFKFFQTGFIDL